MGSIILPLFLNQLHEPTFMLRAHGILLERGKWPKLHGKEILTWDGRKPLTPLSLHFLPSSSFLIYASHVSFFPLTGFMDSRSFPVISLCFKQIELFLFSTM